MKIKLNNENSVAYTSRNLTVLIVILRPFCSTLTMKVKRLLEQLYEVKQMIFTKENHDLPDLTKQGLIHSRNFNIPLYNGKISI